MTSMNFISSSVIANATETQTISSVLVDAVNGTCTVIRQITTEWMSGDHPCSSVSTKTDIITGKDLVKILGGYSETSPPTPRYQDLIMAIMEVLNIPPVVEEPMTEVVTPVILTQE